MFAQLGTLTDPTELFKLLNGLSPLGIIGLLAYIIFQLVVSKKADRTVAANLQHSVANVADNHLSDLPELLRIARDQLELAKAIARHVDTLEQDLKDLTEHIVYIRGRINGRDR